MTRNQHNLPLSRKRGRKPGQHSNVPSKGSAMRILYEMKPDTTLYFEETQNRLQSSARKSNQVNHNDYEFRCYIAIPRKESLDNVRDVTRVYRKPA